MKIQVVCTKTSKKGNFIRGEEYEGTVFSDTHYRLIGEDNKPHLMKKKDFIQVVTI